MRNQRIAAKIRAVLERRKQEDNGTKYPVATQTFAERLQKAKYFADRRMENVERNWKLQEIADRENIAYMTVYRALKGKPGWLAYGGTIRVTDSLYRNWLTAVTLGMSLERYLGLDRHS